MEVSTPPKWGRLKQQKPSSSSTERPREPGDDSLGNQFDVFVAPSNAVSSRLEKVKAKARDEDSSTRRMKSMLTCKAKERVTGHTLLAKAMAARRIPVTGMETP